MSPLLILSNPKRPIFPGYLSSVVVKDKDIIEAIVNNTTAGANGYVGVFLRKPPVDGANDVNTDTILDVTKDIYSVGTFAQIQHTQKVDGGLHVFLFGHRRITMGDVHSYGPPTIANVDHWKRPKLTEAGGPHLKAYLNEVISLARELIKDNVLLQEQLHGWVSRIDFNDGYKLADFATVLTTAEGPELQKVLEATDPVERLSLVLDLLAKEKELVKLQREISKQVEEKVSKQQRDYFLREQLKNIKKELGMEKDDKEDLVGKYNAALHEIEGRPATSHEAVALIRDEIKKLESLEKNSAEFNVTRSYLDWLTVLPWGLYSKDVLNLKHARTVLDEDHYGLEEIKDRILEFIAVGKLKGTVAGKIICFIGPPGVGKTSIAKSIARALDKKFFRFSVGGLTDTAEIKGHRRTYVGAMPGKPVQCLKSTNCVNPLILIDEIDKLGRSYNGDPSSALLELLDPNQNESFVDHYLDVPMDFSGVLFVCTANDESTIPGPLRDRMEIIRLSGYDIREKVAIASKYLVPKALSDAGLVVQSPLPESEGGSEGGSGASEGVEWAGGDVISFTDDALHLLVKGYCRESGVRSLSKMVDKVARKLALKRVRRDEGEGEGVEGGVEGESKSEEGKEGKEDKEMVKVITVDNLSDFVGKPIFTQDTMYEESTPTGVVMGLAWNPLGGCPIFIETAAIPVAYTETPSGVRVVTGQLGDVMKESVSIAFTYARQHLSRVDSENKFFNLHQLHLHVPEGAVSKDGPSAGVAMTTSLLSIALGRPVNPKVAMTGEISLTGKVLPVGGIKEKVLAARRAGATVVILPQANKRDYDELPEYIRENITAHFASHYSEVFPVAFSDQ
ncbi:putative lon protease [Ochromonadaceae sp. CCMP2298]|nr:putative lon protease [Ochromonadaceae sp. CCMP2298]KAJ1443794.1 putative lon protease [Ochromonadaceae sp. CCMP2298]